MEKYELMVLFKPLLPEEDKESVQEGVRKFVGKYKGKVLETDVWGKRHLAYEINGLNEGYYIIYKVELPAKAADSIDKEFKLIPDILRHLLIKEDNL
jgi:small subunit ribosomal protein S6